MQRDSVIHIGDTISLWTKSAYAKNAPSEECSLGFARHRNGDVLVVASREADFAPEGQGLQRAYFVVTPVPGSKLTIMGTPLQFSQPFILKGVGKNENRSLNNKAYSKSGAIDLQSVVAKGEMHVIIEKPGFTPETHILDGDSEVSLTVVDSTRLRKGFNKTLTHFVPTKANASRSSGTGVMKCMSGLPGCALPNAPGGIVCCLGRGPKLSFTVRKVPDSELKKLQPTKEEDTSKSLPPVPAKQEEESAPSGEDAQNGTKVEDAEEEVRQASMSQGEAPGASNVESSAMVPAEELDSISQMPNDDDRQDPSEKNDVVANGSMAVGDGQEPDTTRALPKDEEDQTTATNEGVMVNGPAAPATDEALEATSKLHTDEDSQVKTSKGEGGIVVAAATAVEPDTANQPPKDQVAQTTVSNADIAVDMNK